MIKSPDDLGRRLRGYLRTYDGQASAMLRRRPIRNAVHTWERRAPNRTRLLQASAVVAFTTAVFVLFAGAFALGRSGAATHASHGATGHPSVAATATATPVATPCTILAHSADYDLYSIAPDSSSAPVSCQAAIATAELACPPARPMCAGVRTSECRAHPPVRVRYRCLPSSIWGISQGTSVAVELAIGLQPRRPIDARAETGDGRTDAADHFERLQLR